MKSSSRRDETNGDGKEKVGEIETNARETSAFENSGEDQLRSGRDNEEY